MKLEKQNGKDVFTGCWLRLSPEGCWLLRSESGQCESYDLSQVDLSRIESVDDWQDIYEYDLDNLYEPEPWCVELMCYLALNQRRVYECFDAIVPADIVWRRYL